MTDVAELAKRLFRRIEWQRVPDDVTREDLSQFVADGIRHLYVMTGRGTSFSEDLFGMEGDLVVSFAREMPLDEQEYALISAEIDFYAKVQSTVDDLTSYTTDAMSVSHGDKPFANLQKKLEDLRQKQTRLWYAMGRFHHL